MDYDVGIVRRRRIISPDECYFSVPAGFAPKQPNTLTGLLAWYKADAGVTATGGLVTGNPVTAWADQSGNNHGMTNFGTVPYSSNGFNGFPAMNFAGTGGLTNQQNVLSGLTAVTIYAAISLNAATAQSTPCLTCYSHDNIFSVTGSMFVLSNATPTLEARILGDSSSAFSNTIVSNTLYRTCYEFDGTNSNVYVNNVAFTQGTSGTTIDSTAGGNLCIGAPSLGGGPNSGFNCWGGYVAEIIFQSGAGSVNDRGGIDAYFTSRYGI
jgi:hypothetical protein